MMQQDEKADKSPHQMLDFSNLTHETLAGYLLQSNDPKVQSAAKRIFSIASEDKTSEAYYEKFKPEKIESSSECPSSPVSDLLSTMASAAAMADKANEIASYSNESSPNNTAKTQSFSAQKSYDPQRSGCTIADLIACTSTEKNSGYDKVQRRERNRMHARKTRQRKKEHMSSLQQRAEELKREQVRLRQIINEQNTATILLVMFGQSASSPRNAKDNSLEDHVDIPSVGSGVESFLNEKPVSSEVEALLRRPVSEIPDSTKVPDLPALVYPIGRMPGEISTPAVPMNLPDDGIDYNLLSKDRSKCTPEELDCIRKERNRMHAKRTRDRKRLFMEEMETIIKTLENENRILVEHHHSLKRKKSKQTSSLDSLSTSGTVVSSSGASLCGDNDHVKEYHYTSGQSTSKAICGSMQPPTKKHCSISSLQGNERKVSDVDADAPTYAPPSPSSSTCII